MIETDRLKIYPASQEQMERLISAETNADLRKAYTEMLEGCLKHPEQWDWYAMWIIELKTGNHIGDLCFKGLNIDGTAEIGYGVLDEYQGQGYASEAVKAACGWAFRNPKVVSVEAETEPENKASQRVLEKCGFVPNGKIGTEGPRFTLTRKKITIKSEKITAEEYIGFLKRTDLGSQYPLERFEERIPRLLNSVSISLTARNEDGMLVGVLLGLTDFAYWLYVTDLGVDRNYTHQGIGKQLMKTAHEMAGGEKDIAVYLIANDQAIPFYEKLGMEKADDVMRYNHVDWTEFVVK